MHYFDGGNCIGRFQLATNEVYITKPRTRKITSTEWHNLVVRNKAAEICEKHLSKGIKYMLRDVLSHANGRQRTDDKTYH
jgi:single-strand DNA-binding protein